MVIDPPLYDWSARLARLERFPGHGAEETPWLRSIRIRILRYLLARYGQGPDVPDGTSDRDPVSVACARRPDPPAEASFPGVRPFAHVDHPPRDGRSFASSLEELHHLARARRRETGADGPAEEAWCWWSERWCRSPGRRGIERSDG